MEYYSTYKQESLNLGMHKIAKLVLKSAELDYRYRVIIFEIREFFKNKYDMD